MGHVQKRVRGGQVRWRARVPTPQGRETSKTFTRKVDAERWVREQESAKDRGGWVDPQLGRTTVGEWAPRWLDSKRRVKPEIRAGYESLLRSRIIPTLGGVPLARLQRVDVEQWVGGMLASGLSASRTRQAYNVLAGMLDAAVANGMLARNVAGGVELPTVRPAERRFLTTGSGRRLG